MSDLNDKLMSINLKEAPFKISPLKDPAAHMLYVQKMVKEIEDKKIEKRKVNTVQQPSTQRLLSMGPDELEKHKARALPTKREAAADRDADDIHSQHKGGDIAVHFAELARERPKNSQGQTEGSAFAHRKDEAREAFMGTDAKLSNRELAMINTAPEGAIQKDVEHWIGVHTLEKKPRPWWKKILGIRWVWREIKNDEKRITRPWQEDEWIWRMRK